MSTPTRDELVQRFGPQLPAAAETVFHMRGQAFGLACQMATELPPGREATLALQALEEALMWATKSLTRPEQS